VLILLPPSEGKATPQRGRPLDLATLSFPELAPARERVLDALVTLCSGDPAVAARTLGLGPTQLDQVDLDERVRTSPTARADRIYTGVLFDALDLPGLSPAAKRRAAGRLAVTSSLFGLVRPGDRIPSYRLAGGVSLPGLGAVAGVWREAFGPAMAEQRGLLVDLRSTTYAAFWRPPTEGARRVATVRVLHDDGTTRKVVSHFNKATKGRLVRELLEDGAAPRTPGQLADVLAGLGWKVEVGEPTPAGTRLDVVVSEV
jgi:cytoplasmic iron level regulating protein YaaA (DUF328/UPF0246 family)